MHILVQYYKPIGSLLLLPQYLETANLQFYWSKCYLTRNSM